MLFDIRSDWKKELSLAPHLDAVSKIKRFSKLAHAGRFTALL